MAARLMRQILVDHARRKRASKRGGDVGVVSLEGQAATVSPINVDILALDRALDEMASFDTRQREISSS